MRKLINDTLKNPNGKWSRKSLTLFASFVVALLLGFYIVLSDFFLRVEINKYSIEVFDSFMLLVAALTGATVADKFAPKYKKSEEDL